MLIPVKCDARGRNANAVSAWRDALEKCIARNAEGVLFPRGEYHFHAGGTVRKYCFFSNNDEGVKSIVFHLNGLKNFTLAGEEARFIFHGRLSPLVAENCAGLRIQGISIDFADSFVHEAEAVDCCKKGTFFRMDGKYRVENGRISFFRDAYDNLDGRFRLFPFDRSAGEFPSDAKIWFCPNQVLKRKDDLLLLPVDVAGSREKFFTVRHQGRLNPGMVFDGCRDVVVEECAMHHCGGMGIVAQNTENIRLDSIRVIPSPGRLISASDDALHFADCSGKIELLNSSLRYTLDDALNIHGIYRKLRCRNHCAFLEAGHCQQFGLTPGKDGYLMELSKKDTMKPYATLKVKSFSPVNKQICCVEFTEPLPPEFTDGDRIRNRKAAEAEVTLSGNDISNNHPRGFLVSGVKRAVIEKNRIHSPRAGVYISGDMNFWFETGPVEEVLIRGNRFDHCCYVATASAHAPVTVAPEIPSPEKDFFYHGRILVRDNVFLEESVKPAVKAFSADTVDFSGNTLYAGKKQGMRWQAVEAQHCRSVISDCNKVKSGEN